MLLLFTVFCSLRLQYSRLGRAWIAIREDETAAAAMGMPLMRTKTWAYASGAFFGGVAGAYYAIFKSATFPGDFFFNISVFILCMVILGGMGNIWGVIVGAAFLAYLDQEGLANTGAWINTNVHVGNWHPNLDVPLYASGIYGLIILIVMLFRPEGLIPSKRARRRAARGRARRAALRRTHAGAGGVSDVPQTNGDLLVATDVRKEFGGLVAVNDVVVHGAARQGDLADRPERGGQDDVLQHADRRLQADRRHGHVPRRGRDRASRRTRSQRAASAAPSRTSASSRT